METIELLKSESNAASDTFDQFAPVYAEVIKQLKKFSLTGEFKTEIKGATEFSKNIFMEKISLNCWEKILKEVNFLSSKQREQLLDDLKGESLCYTDHVDKYVSELEKNRHEKLEETLNCIYGDLTEYIVWQKGRRKDIKAKKVEEKVKFCLFGNFDDGYWYNRHGVKADWLSDLEMIMLTMSGQSLKESGSRFGDTLKTELAKAVQSEGRFQYEQKCDFFNLKVFKPGNVEITFINGSDILLNHFYKSCQKMTLKQYEFYRNFRKHIAEDTRCNIGNIKLVRANDKGAQVVSFDFKNSKDTLVYNGHLAIYTNLIEAQLYNPEKPSDLIDSFKVLDRNAQRSLYRDLVDYLKKEGKNIESMPERTASEVMEVAKMEMEESVEFEREERARKLNILELKEASTGEKNTYSKWQYKRNRKLEILLGDEYNSCELIHDKDKLTGWLEAKGTAYNIEVTDMLKIWGDNCELSVKIGCQKITSLLGFIKLSVASFELMMDKTEEARRVLDNHKVASQKASKISEDPEPVYELSGDDDRVVNIIHNADKGTYIEGDTKPVKEDLKRYGFSWSWESRTWYVRGSKRRGFCEESLNRLDRLSELLAGKNIRVIRSYPEAAEVVALEAH